MCWINFSCWLLLCAHGHDVQGTCWKGSAFHWTRWKSLCSAKCTSETQQLLQSLQNKTADTKHGVKLSSLWYEAPTSKTKPALALCLGISELVAGGSALGCGEDVGWVQSGGLVLVSPLPCCHNIPLAGQTARLQMQIAISGCTAPNLEFIHCQQELKPETILVCATSQCECLSPP